MADLNINAKLPGSDAIKGFVRENLVNPVQQSQKADAKDGIESAKRQEIASKQTLSDAISDMPEEKLDETVSQLNDSLQNVQRNLEFSIDQDVGKIVINVRDKQTDEIIRQIPNEEVLELAKNLHAASERFNDLIDSHSQSSADGVFLRSSA